VIAAISEIDTCFPFIELLVLIGGGDHRLRRRCHRALLIVKKMASVRTFNVRLKSF